MSQDVRRTEEQSTQRRSQILGLSYYDTSIPGEKRLFKDVMTIDELRQFKVIPLNADQHNISFGVTNTTSHQTMELIRGRFLDHRVSFSLISDTGFSDYMKLYDPPKQVIYEDVTFSREDDGELFSRVTKTLSQVLADDVLAYLVKQCYQLKGSDIHLENQKEAVRIRIRVDGVLHPVAEIAHDKFRQVLSSIAIAANVSTGSPEAQTGHISKPYRLATGEEVTVNLRVETVPTVYGVDVVMRLFNFKLEYLKLENLGLNDSQREAVDDVISHPTGMVLIVGPTGSGKSTSLAAMVNHININRAVHIITIEDPIEYVHPHKNCIITQRELGIDTDSWEAALKNTLRQAPDVILMGEIRDRETMEHAVAFAETGHLCMATLHANSANQALDRVINFFPEEKREQLLMDLSLNLKAIISQRLIRKEGGGRVAAMEIMINSPLIADMVFKGEVAGIKEVMARSNEQGMITFDQFLFQLFEDGLISYDEAVRNADSQNELRLKVKLESKRARQNLMDDEMVKKMQMKEDDSANLMRR